MIAVLTMLLAGTAGFSTPCFLILSKDPAPLTAGASRAADPVESDAAFAWLDTNVSDGALSRVFAARPALQNFVSGQGLEWSSLNAAEQHGQLALFARAQWERWKQITPPQRSLAADLELSRLRPKNESNIASLSGTRELEDSGRANADRMLARLRETFPLPASAETFRAQAEKVVAGLRISYLRGRAYALEKSPVYEPVVSPREMRRLGLQPFNLDYFYSDLVDTATTVDFELVATSNASAQVYNLRNEINRVSFRASDALAESAGFVIPHFGDARAMVAFFKFWDPAALDELARQNVYSLPARVRDGADLSEFIKEPQAMAQLFPIGTSYQRLSVLRTRLARYALRPSDTAYFLRQAFTHWILLRAARGELSFDQLSRKANSEGGMQKLIKEELLPFLQMNDGMSLRLPVAVTAKDYSIVRTSGLHYNPYLEPQGHRNRFRPVDHATMSVN